MITEIQVAMIGKKNAKNQFLGYEKRVFSSVYKNDDLMEDFEMLPAPADLPAEHRKAYNIGYAIGCYSMAIGFRDFLKGNKLHSSLESLMNNSFIRELCADETKNQILHFIKENSAENDLSELLGDFWPNNFDCIYDIFKGLK